MTTGAGLSPAGLAPAGIGLPDTSHSLAATGYGKSTTGAVSSIKLDYRTLDSVHDAWGNETGISDTEQRVALCLRTVRGSRLSFLASGFAPPTKVTDQVRREVQEAVRLALLPVTSDGSAALVAVTVEPHATSVWALVTWRDNRRSTETTTRATL